MSDETYIKMTLAGVMALTGLAVMGWAIGDPVSAEMATVRTACQARGMKPFLVDLDAHKDRPHAPKPVCVDKSGALYALD